MPRPQKNAGPVVRKLEEINTALQGLLILECARAGIKKADVRSITGCDMNRVTRIWKHIKAGSDE